MSRPAKGTPEWDLWIAAIEIAMVAPWKGQTYAARIPWDMIDTLREKLEAVGIDWRTAKRDQYGAPPKREYSRHTPTDRHEHDDPTMRLLCSCGAPISYMLQGKLGWFCTSLGTPTEAFRKLGPAPEDTYG